MMRYYSKIDEGIHEWGDPPYYLEINAEGHAERQLAIYPDDKVISCDRTHEEDEFGALAIMVVDGVDGNEEWWEQYKISKDKFEETWQSHKPCNRDFPLADVDK